MKDALTVKFAEPASPYPWKSDIEQGENISRMPFDIVMIFKVSGFSEQTRN